MNKEILENMTTPELDEILNAELQKDVPDGDLVRQIIRVLEDREKDYPVEVTPQIQAALEKFNAGEQGRAERPRPTARNWVLRAAPAAAMLCVILLAVIPQPAKAETWLERFARWTESVFEFVISGEADDEKPEYVFQTDNPGLQEVYDAVTELGVTVPVVPMWIPEGYELVECKKQNTKDSVLVGAVFSAGEKRLIFGVYALSSDADNKYQKSRDAVVEYELDGITHNIMHNNGSLTAAWMNSNVECMLSIECQEDVLCRIIKSIYITEVYA